MSLPSNNQVMQLYVAKTAVAVNGTPAALGACAPCGEAGKSLYFKHMGYGGLTSSDKIDVDKIGSITLTDGANIKTHLKNHTITVTEVSAGQIYEVKLQFGQYIGLGEQDMTYRLGLYRSKKNDTAATIAAGLAKSLQDALGLDAEANAADADHYKERLATVTVNGAVITVSEVEQDWYLGRFPVAHMPIKVFLNGIFSDGEYETFDWATISTSDDTVAEDNGKKLADLEYVCMGARGDIYRGMGYPRNMITKYLVDPESVYDIINIHYWYQGSNESVQKSEKDLAILVPTGNTTLINAIKTLVGDKQIDKVDADGAIAVY